MALIDALLLDPAPFDVWIAVRTDGIKGSGRVSDPYDGSTQAKFDGIMNLFAAASNMAIHLGPGIFQTNGYNGTIGWQARPGMKIRGSGIDVTTIQLINVAPGSATHYFAIGHALTTPVDAFEVSHLTIDCNLAGTGTNTNAACGGVRVLGNNVLIHRIKVKNWGTRTTSMPCYAVALIPAQTAAPLTEVKNCGIADCIVIDPEPATDAPQPPTGVAVSGGIATALYAGPNSESGSATQEAYGLSVYIRNCFADGSSAGKLNLGYDLRGLSMSWCRAGVVEGNHVHNMKTGGPFSDKTTIQELVVRNNFYKNVANGPCWSLGNLCTASLTTGGSVSLSSGVLTLGITGHNLNVGDRIKLVTASGTFNGTYRVDSVVDTGTLTVKTTAGGSNTTVASGTKKVFGANKLLIEGNIVELATGSTGVMGIRLHDNGSGTTAATPDYVYGEVIVRNNKIRYLDGSYDSLYTGRGIEVNGAKNLLVQQNVVDVTESGGSERLRNARCGSVAYFNDKMPNGVLVRGINKDNGFKYNELETDAEDAFILGMLKRS